MTPKKTATLFTTIFALMIAVQSCSHYDMEKNISMVSKNGEDESHYNGENCMNCHATGGKGEGWFNVAGSVYKADKVSGNPNGKVMLYTDPDGQGSLKYTIDVDDLGNFYTTEDINFEGGLYAAHQNSSDSVVYMQSPILNGQCQSCHNVSTDKIWND